MNTSNSCVQVLWCHILPGCLPTGFLLTLISKNYTKMHKKEGISRKMQK